MRTPRSLVAMVTLAVLLAGGFEPSTAAACCRPAPTAVSAPCGDCCPQPSVCAPRSADEATTGRAFSYKAPTLASTGTSLSVENHAAGRPMTAPRPLPSATPPHLSHIPLLV